MRPGSRYETHQRWHSIRPAILKRMLRRETKVIIVTVIVIVVTHNLAIGVVAGVIIAVIAFACRVAHLANLEHSLSGEGPTPSAYYTVTGALFSASSNDLLTQFEYAEDPERIVIDMSGSHFWDASTVATLDAIAYKYERHKKHAVIEGLNEASTTLRKRLPGNTGSDH